MPESADLFLTAPPPRPPRGRKRPDTLPYFPWAGMSAFGGHLAQPLSVAPGGSVKHQGRLAGTLFSERDALQGFAHIFHSVG